MAQPQPQAQMPPRAFSPPQPTPSPAASQSSFALPPNKRVRTDGPASQPGSPYATSPYAASPGATGTPPGTAASPAYAQSPALPGGYTTPYTNGHGTPGLNLPNTQPTPTPPLQSPHHLSTPMPQYTTATMAPIGTPTAGPSQGHGVMGPPQRPAERPTKDYEYDVTDSLAGTGIDLRAEEQYMNDLYSTNFEANHEARTGFPQHPPGAKSTFYGAGIANQPTQSIPDASQQQFAAQQAEKAWQESTMRLAVQRTQEIGDPFLLVAMLHRRAEKVAREHHIGLNLDLKNNNGGMGKMRLPDQFPQPKVTVKVTPGPDSTIVNTTGSYIPHDAYLVDQLALMSIATKHRLRELVEDASLIATHRQKTSHGDVPEEWAPAAAPMNAEPLEPIEDAVNGAGVDGANGSSTTPPKRSADAAELDSRAPPKKLPKISSYMTTTMRELARQEREWEEARLRKRQKRKDGIPDSGITTSRAGSVALGTPGSVAPEPEKALTKKEMKKNQALKAAEANSHANQNMTSSMFAGLGGKGGLFGKKKTGKTYDWMNVGRGGSGTSTPTRNTGGAGKGGGAGAGAAAPANMALTTEGRNRLGTWREDKEKGRNIQLRDWVSVLERDGREPKALQRAYMHLDASNPK
ncbi:Fc.00g017710.m01.CDS01 [Cosmosporella sp. VM-42]